MNGNENTIAKNNVTGVNGGIYIDKGSYNTIYANRITSWTGMVVTNDYNNTFYTNHIANCNVGTIIGGAQSEWFYKISGPATANNTICHNNFIDNTPHIKTDFPTGYSFYGADYFDNGEEDNYWSGYKSNDANRDGIGDTIIYN